MVLLQELIRLAERASEFYLEIAEKPRGTRWERVASEPVSREDAEEWLSQNTSDPDYVHRARAVSGGEILYPRGGRAGEPRSTLARDASPEVHKRNADFFDRHL